MLLLQTSARNAFAPGEVYLQACQITQAVKAAADIALSDACDVQLCQLSEEPKIFKCALVEDVIAVFDMQAGQAGAYCRKDVAKGVAIS